MTSLKIKMAENGFESNDDYEYALYCFLNQPLDHIRCLNVTGDSNRRKTAFAHALAAAMEYPHVLYHDFLEEDLPLPASARIDADQDAEIPRFDRVVSEACAYSEGENTILILDQLQEADFRQHIRIYELITCSEWKYAHGTAHANKKNLLVFLISENALYHSLHKCCFRVWTDASQDLEIDFRPEEFGLDNEAIPLINAMQAIFRKLGMIPTLTEYRRILHDLFHHIRDTNGLKQSIYGWAENADRQRLHDEKLEEDLGRVICELERYLKLDKAEIIEL